MSEECELRTIVTAFAAGLIFGLGLTISGMINPEKVLNFLDLFGTWDPSLAFVMAGALIVTSIGYRIAFGRGTPLLEAAFHLPTKKDVDGRLLSGSALFGVGWGLGGYCPGPGIAGIGLGALEAAAFVAAMGLGMVIFTATQEWIPPRTKTA